MALTFANKVTVGRILIVPFFIATVMYISSRHPILRWVALGLFLLAVASDIIDGYIARTRGQKTRAGAILDPLADKMLLISAFICLYIKRAYFSQIDFPLWFVVGIISRDVILLLGSMIIQLTTGKLEIEANRAGKLTAFLQIVCVLGVLLQMKFTFVFWYVALVVTFISGVVYIKEGIKAINESAISGR
ncbi:MAG: CDP-alcohol phosphatidyltransferase family protein [Candidatus Omnitrophica bacterium]|nr:CDP-alcohol phosphatidyltransferase family protein [Candidatus Omnitrophota bacterium]MDE2008636.1 CDP-alcohol phosphatidyltransferase family protein [Candidatus Omnitrophota bacterium]MDE2214981.1 CDP-alcohol phosphatidyltransferase family protein [Candidatus Omnitrophota bacterium]MDE2230920.1 CDP-alcohol phosphatidyltransferase family protein [Candidatus Omnitrophota bacterium]